MRPTIPLANWRIAVNLSATQSVQNQPGQPAYGCRCRWCANWSRGWTSAFPSDVHQQLERLCIDIAHPSELYAFEEAPGGAHCRVIYHVVGKLLSGPAVWHEDTNLGKTLVYHPIGEAKTSIGLAVIPCSQTWEMHPQSDQVSRSELLQIDFWLFVALSKDPALTSAYE
jgi:hypothetical protein